MAEEITTLSDDLRNGVDMFYIYHDGMIEIVMAIPSSFLVNIPQSFKYPAFLEMNGNSADKYLICVCFPSIL